ncbi:MAG: GspE/PulE family protein, partial [Gemmataceae bacterium]
YNSYTVFFRHLGVRRIVHEGDLEEYNMLVARIKDLSRMDLAERRIPQDGGYSMEYNGKLVDLRVATLPVGSAEYVVIRLLDPDRVQPNLDKLGITRVDEWRKGVSRPDGLCLICGPTGSGKTTTLNASIREMDRFASSIFTLEDPVEYRIPYIGQVNINQPLGLDFARGIRAFMRS